MVLRHGEDMWKELPEYSRDEPIYNTSLLADVSNFGLDKEFQNVYTEVEEGVTHNMYLTSYQNLILYNRESRVNQKFLKDLFTRWTPVVVMGRFANARQVTGVLPGHRLKEKPLYLLEDGNHLVADDVRGVKAAPGDEDKLYKFLIEIPQMRTFYGPKEMIGDQPENGDDVHFYREENGCVIARAGSAVKSRKTVMIGGVAILSDRRREGIASALASHISQGILEREKAPCLFCEREEEHNPYARLGFREISMRATFQKVEKKLPSYILVYNQLYQDLMDDVCGKDSLLSSENALAATYEVSRDTLRQAPMVLYQGGHIYKHQGRGAYVSYDSHKKEEKNLYNFLMNYAKELILNVAIDYSFGKPTLITKERLRLEPEEEVLANNNVYRGEESPVRQAFLQILVHLLDNLGTRRDSEEAFVQFMNEQLYQQAITGGMVIQTVGVDEQAVLYMKIEEETILFYIEQILFGREERPLVRVKYYFLPDRYRTDCRLQV